MRKTIFVGMLLLAGVAGATLTGLATDQVEPAWRGQANTTLQAWSFDTGDNPGLVTLDENLYGTPSAEVFVPDTGFPKWTYWMASDYSHTGVWRIYEADYLQLYIPNTRVTSPDSYKEIWLQITYSSGEAGRHPEIQTDPVYTSLTLVKSTILDSLYYRDVFRIIIEPNPTEEWISIMPRDCVVYIDEIVVDTICIPEPATMLILGLGAVLLRKRK